MPRPKRTNVSTSKAAIVPPRVAKPNTARESERQLEVLTATSDRVTTGSDDSEGLVKTTRNWVNKKGNTISHDMTMSGALAPEDTAGGRMRPLTGRKRAVLSKIARNADHDKAIEALKARRDAALAATQGVEVQMIPTEPTVVTEPVAEQPEGASDFVAVVAGKYPSIPATPRGGLASAFRGSNVKRRPRQPSLLQLVQARTNPRDEGEDDDLDDFHPDDESTPFLQAKSQILPQNSLSPSSGSSANQSSSRKRKRSSLVIQVERSQSPETRASSPKNPSATPELELEDDVYNLPSPSTNHEDRPEPSLPMPKSMPRSPQPSQSKQWSDTCAPPRSSSPSSHELPKPLLQRGHQMGQPPPPSSPASRPLKPLSTATLQNLLPRRRVRPNMREHSPFDVPSSSDVELDTSRLSAEADELSVAAKPKVRAKKQQAKDPVVKTPFAKKKPHGSSSHKNDGRGGSRATNPPTKPPKLKKPKKTYTRAEPTISTHNDHLNHENENLPHINHDDDDQQQDRNNTTSHPPIESTQSTTELQRLARKFREVDRWELEVEDVTPSSGS